MGFKSAVWGPELFRNTIVMKSLLNFPRSMDGTVVIHEKLVLGQRVDSGCFQQINIVCTLASFCGLQQYSRPIATYAAPKHHWKSRHCLLDCVLWLVPSTSGPPDIDSSITLQWKLAFVAKSNAFSLHGRIMSLLCPEQSINTGFCSHSKLLRSGTAYKVHFVQISSNCLCRYSFNAYTVE